ncbi:MAG TPA: DUF6084 family protein [Bryobacteraceae bacterium]|nr:DUF6084 family protein [Bryobacteraceae bacterium]
MPDLNFRVEDAAPVAYAAAPALGLRVRVENADPAEEIRGISLHCQIRIEAARRSYSAAEQRALVDLFGAPERWGRTLRSMLWAHAAAAVPAFRGAAAVVLPVACTFDLTVATAKYFHGLEQGCVPLSLLFSGSVFYQDEDGGLALQQIPWSKEAAYALPSAVWGEMMDTYYPNTAWLCLRRDVADRLRRYQAERGMASWEQALESLLP